MTRVLVDANVFLHALGDDPALRPACERVIAQLAAGRLRGEAAALMVEEVVHVRHRRRGDRARAVEDGRAAASLLRALHPVSEPELEAALEIFAGHGTLHARDAVHVAVARRHGLEVLLSTDRGFDVVDGLRRIDPVDGGALAQLAAG